MMLSFGSLLIMHFRDDLLDEACMRRFAPVGRLGGPDYARTSDRLRVRVPTFLPTAGKAPGVKPSHSCRFSGSSPARFRCVMKRLQEGVRSLSARTEKPTRLV